jgi:Protein of unknown function (DUF2950)
VLRTSHLKEKQVMRGKDSLEKGSLRGPAISAAVATFALLLVGAVQLCLARPPSQMTFASPEEASHALFSAVQSHDEQALTQILGAGTELVSSDDKAQDTLDRERFVQKYQEMHRLVQEPKGVTALYIGAENWPFPILLVSRAGVWRFDSDGGANEIRFRRIGENEVTAIGICHALVAPETHPGTDGEADSLVKIVLPHVQDANRPVPFHGYYFRILSKSGGGFAAIAYPALYRSSGVMTFIVNQDDVVYEKDLGPNTGRVARAMTTYHADPTWAPAESMP